MVVPIQVQIDAKGALKKMMDVQNFVRIDVPRLTFGQAVEGQEYAARIAPKDTGALIQALDVRQTEKGERSRGWAVISRTPPNINNNNPKHKPYHAYLEYGRKVNVRGGRKQRFMAETALWLNKKYPSLVSKGLGQAIRK